MPKVSDAIVTFRRTVQVVNFQPEEAVVSLRLVYEEGEVDEPGDLETALDKCRDAVYKRLGIEDEVQVVSGSESVAPDVKDTRGIQAHGAGSEVRGLEPEQVSRETSGRGRGRGANPPAESAPQSSTPVETPTVSTGRGRRGVSAETQPTPMAQPSTGASEPAPSASPSSGRGRGRGVNPTQTSPDSTGAAEAATAGVPSRGRGGSNQAAPSSAETVPEKAPTQADISKACSHMAQKVGPHHVMALLEEFGGAKTANDLEPEHYLDFLNAVKLKTA